MADSKELICFNILALQPSSFANPWVFYIVHPNFDKEYELRHKAFLILINGFIDILKNYKKHSKLIESMENYNTSLTYYIKFMKLIKKEILEVISLYSEEELLYFQEQRNQLVHASLDGFMKDTRSYYVINNNDITSKNVGKIEYFAMYKRVMDSNTSQDIHNYLTRLQHKKTSLWSIFVYLKNIQISNLIREDIREGMLKQK